MKLNINVSVIVPVYNHQNFITECLESLLSQDYQDWEAIIINDGSTDNSLSIINDYAKKDSRFVVIDQQNMGILNLHKIYNNALKISKGEFIAVLEGDDYWPSDKLSRQIKSFRDEKVGLSWGDGTYVDINGNKILKIDNQEKKWSNDIVTNTSVGSATKYFLFASNFFNMPTCSVMYRKKVLTELNGFWQPKDLKWLDRPTWLLVSLKYKFAYCNFNTAYWRRHDAQITSTNDDIKSSLEYMLDSIEDRTHDIQNKFKNYRIEIKTQIYLTNIYRQLSLKKLFPIGTNLLKLFILTISHPIRVIKHINFINKVKRLNR